MAHYTDVQLYVTMDAFYRSHGEAGVGDRRNVDEHVFGAVVRLDETVALVAVEKLNTSCRHLF